MPELPEVETVRRQLLGRVLGVTFTGVGRVEPSMLLDCSADLLSKQLPGMRVNGVERIGKYLVLPLTPAASEEVSWFLTLHLGMTGQLLLDSDGDSPHTRFLFQLETAERGPVSLEFRDMRKFGRVYFTAGGPPTRLSALGPDAWTGEWDAAYLLQKLSARRTYLKAFLLDQRHLSGIGNIYSDEILWWAELSPLRACSQVTAREAERLACEVRRVLDEGVRLLGCTISDFVDTGGNAGQFQLWLRAYGKQGQECSRCGGRFVRVVVAGRGTSFCPGCQR